MRSRFALNAGAGARVPSAKWSLTPKLIHYARVADQLESRDTVIKSASILAVTSIELR
jgi:hypothetical protein